MKKYLCILFALTVFNINGQNSANTIDGLTLCSHLGGKSFSNNKAADSALEEILNVIGASKRFVIQPCNNVDNAAAITLLGVRYIFYNPNWMSDLQYSGDWANKFILAHEVGHHINNHTIDAALRLSGQITNSQDLASSRYEELEADEFAGFVLGRLGATLNQALSAVRNLSNADDTYSTHPKRDKRINAVKKGFNNSGGRISSSNNSVKKGKSVDSPYSNARYSGVVYQKRNDIFNDGIYEGYIGVNSDKPFGYGTFFGENGYVYEGEWADGKHNGYGKRTFSSGNIEEGFFVNGNFTGKGVRSESNGTVKTGSFTKSKLNGEGKMVFESGAVLSGKFYNGQIIEATYTRANGEEKKIGFLDGSRGNGYATFTDAWGNTYTGNWKNGKIVTQKHKKYKGKNFVRRARQSGLDQFIPDFVLKGLDINMTSSSISDEAGYLIKRFLNEPIIHKGYFENGFWHPERSGFIETKIDNPDLTSWDFKYGFPKYDLSYSIYWNDDRNGYAAFFLNGKLVQKGVYQGGYLVKEEDFDLDLMLETLKQF